MNLWVSRVRQLSVMAVALFFYSCTDDTALNGFKPTDPKFTAQFIEIPVESSVLMFDPLRSSNYHFSGETNRFLVGNLVGTYRDPVFGDVSASACTQFFTTSTIKLASTAELMSASIQLRFDYYTYGASKAASVQEIAIYELDQELNTISIGSYFTNTPIVAKTELLGSKSFSLDPTEFQSYIDDESDTTIMVRVPLDGPVGKKFGEDLFASAIRYRDATSTADSAFTNYSEFIKQFKGIAIKATSSGELFGFSSASDSSRISLRYRTATDTLELNFSFLAGRKVSGKTANTVYLAGYNNITTDRANTALANLTTSYQDFDPMDGKNYIQSGAGIFTKLDIGKFLEFTDTIPNIMINSAELVIGNVEDGGAFDPPQNLALRVLESSNRQYAYSTETTQSNYDRELYYPFLRPDFYYSTQLLTHINSDSVFTVVNDGGGTYVGLNYSKSEKKYSGYLTRFLQQVAVKTLNKTRLQYFVLYPSSPSAAKTVNRVVFPKDNIKLRVYYTLPTIKK